MAAPNSAATATSAIGAGSASATCAPISRPPSRASPSSASRPPASAAKMHAPAMTLRRSTRSENRPSGTWASAPPTSAALMNRAMPVTDMPICVAKTAPSPPNAPFASPTKKPPTTPTGDMRVQTAEPEPHLAQRLRRIGRGQTDRHQRERDGDRGHREQREAGRGAERQHHLAGGHRAEVDHHVDRQDLAAIDAGGALVEPALDHHEQAGEADAAERAQRDPHDGMHGERHDQHHRRRDRGADREGADVADPPDDVRHAEAAGHEADRIGGRDQADRGGGERLEGRAHRQQDALQAVAEEQDGDRQKQRAEGADGLGHEQSPAARAPARNA